MEQANLYQWDQLEKEAVSDTVDRTMVVGEKSMLARLYLKEGAVVARHQHENEQFTCIMKGELVFYIGENEEQVVTVQPGQVLHIPSNVPHKIIALKDTIDLDIFTPVRSDWLNGTDSYFSESSPELEPAEAEE